MYNMEQSHIFLAIRIFMLDTVQELEPGLQLNNEFLETLKSDCDMIEANYRELDLFCVSMNMENENRDLALEFQFSSFELTPDSVWLSIFSHVSSIEFRTEDDMVVMKIKYGDIFLNE